MSYKTTTQKQGLSKPAKIAITATALVLLAAIIFGMVWTSLDHSYRYDRQDLSVYLKEGATIDIAGLGNLPLELSTSVTKAKWLDKIKSNILAVDSQVLNSNLFKKTETDISDLAYPDIVYMYYEVYVDETEAGSNEEKLGELLISNVAYANASSATEVRLGSGTLNSMIEDYMTRHREYKTAVERCEQGEALAGYTLAVNILGTYKDANDASQTLIQLTGKNIQATDITATPSSDSVVFYNGATTLKGEATKITGLTLDEDTSDAIIAALAGMEKLGDEAVEIKRDIKLSDSAEETEVTFKIEVTGAFRAEMKKLTFDLSNTTENPEGKPFTYTKPGESKATEVDGKKLALRITVESAIQLDRAVVEYLTQDKTDWVAPTNLGENEDNAYAAAYMEYVKQAMIKEDADAQKADTETYDANVKAALWEEIRNQYATDAYIDLTDFPADVKQDYIDSLFASYAADYYADSKSQSTYKSVENYILTKVYEVADASTMDATKQTELLNSKMTGEVEEAIRERVLLFYLADVYEVNLGRRARRAAEDEIYDALYASAHATYTAYKTYYKLETDADVARAAREDALQQCEAYCTPSYLREYVAINGVRDAIVTAAGGYPEITFTLQDAAK